MTVWQILQEKYSSGIIDKKKGLTKYIFQRDTKNVDYFYQPIAVIEYSGRMSNDGGSSGHYTCDVQPHNTDQWYRTNDNSLPVNIASSEVSKTAFVVLFERS